jgi:hypothetical protein
VVLDEEGFERKEGDVVVPLMHGVMCGAKGSLV